MSRTRVAPFPLTESKSTTHGQVQARLQAAEKVAKPLSFNQAWAEPPVFERLLDRYGLAYFNPDLFDPDQAACAGILGKIIGSKSFLEKIINKPKDLQLLVHHPSLPVFIHTLISQVIAKPELLRKALKALGVSKCVELTGWYEGGLPEPQFAAKMLGQILSDQTLAEQLAAVIKVKTAAKPDSVEAEAAEEFLAVVSRQQPASPGWLGRAFYGFLGGGFGNPITKTVLEVFLKQTPEDQLRILLSINKIPKARKTIMEDAIVNLPVILGEAVYLKMDLPLVVNSEPELYKRETLARLPEKKSPFSRKTFTESDVRPLAEWLNASAEQRFVLLVRNQLTDYENGRVSVRDILDLIQTPLLLHYLRANPLHDLVQRLNKMYPWGQEQVPPFIKELRVRLGQDYFPLEKDWVASTNALAAQVVHLENEAQLEADKKEKESVFSSCFRSYCCLGSRR